MKKICFTGKEIEMIKGDFKGKIGAYLGTDGYSLNGVFCKLLVDTKPLSFRWDYFKFTDPEVQIAWDNEEIETLDFPA